MEFVARNFSPVPARGKIEQVLKETWVAEAKLDGMRVVLGKMNDVASLTGRRDSSKTSEKLDKIAHLPYLGKLIPDGTVVDGELCYPNTTSNEIIKVMGSGVEKAQIKLQTMGIPTLFVFDCLWFDGIDMRNEPFWKRLEYLDYYMGRLNVLRNDHVPDPAYAKCVQRVPTFNQYGEISQCYDMALQQGFEGLVVKSLERSYDQHWWAKMKPAVTFEYVIVDYDHSESDTFAGNGIAALVLGLFTPEGGLIPVTRCSGMTHAWRREFYNNPDKYRGQVVEVKAQQMFPNGSLRHPRFVKLRTDVNANEQTLGKYNIQELPNGQDERGLIA